MKRQWRHILYKILEKNKVTEWWRIEGGIFPRIQVCAMLLVEGRGKWKTVGDSTLRPTFIVSQIHNKPNPLFSSPQQIKAYPYNIATHWMKEYLQARAAL